MAILYVMYGDIVCHVSQYCMSCMASPGCPKSTRAVSPAVLQVKGQRRIAFDQFVNALGIIAEKKAQALRDVVQAVLDTGGPSVIGTRAGYVKFHDDKVWQLHNGIYVGTHSVGLNLHYHRLRQMPPCLPKPSIPKSIWSKTRQRRPVHNLLFLFQCLPCLSHCCIRLH